MVKNLMQEVCIQTHKKTNNFNIATTIYCHENQDTKKENLKRNQ